MSQTPSFFLPSDPLIFPSHPLLDFTTKVVQQVVFLMRE